MKRKTTEEFIEQAIIVHGNKYDYSKAKYDGCKKKICIICPKHGKFEQTLVNHLSGSGCPKCNESKGEKYITNWLNNKNVKYIAQYKIPIDTNINSSGNAFIDFYIPEFNTFIEYNGEQHYIPKDKFGGVITFERQQKRDQYVRDYCFKNNIKLIEIKYNDNINNKLQLL